MRNDSRERGLRILQDRGTGLQSAQIDIGARHIGDHRGDDGAARRAAGLRRVAGGFELTPILAEDIEFPHGVEAGQGVDVLQPGGIVRRHQCLLRAAAGQIGARAPSRGGAGIDLRQRMSGNHRLIGARLLQPCQRLFDVEIGFDRALDQRVELCDRAMTATRPRAPAPRQRPPRRLRPRQTRRAHRASVFCSGDPPHSRIAQAARAGRGSEPCAARASMVARVDGDALACADLAADIEHQPITGGGARTQFHHAAIVARNGDVAELHFAIVVDPRHLRGTWTINQRGRRHLHPAPSAAVEIPH